MARSGRIGLLVVQAASCVSACLLAAPLSASPDSDLEWTLASEETMSWEYASAACAALEVGGHRDWRLPSVEELLFGQETIPSELLGSLEGHRIDAWACNDPVREAPPAAGRQQRQIERLRLEEIELERKLRELECESLGGVDCDRTATGEIPGPLRWQLRFPGGRPDESRRSLGHTLCVRGRAADCRADPKRQLLCVRTLQRREGRSSAPADAVIEAISSDGSRVELGRPDENGDLCVPRGRAGDDPLILACDGAACGAFAPDRGLGMETLILDPPTHGDRVRKDRLCLSLMTPYGQPICGAPLTGLTADGDFVALGRTGIRGRECVKHGRLDSVSLLLVCPWGCQAIAPEFFESSGELVLTLEHYDPPCSQSPRSTCPCSNRYH